MIGQKIMVTCSGPEPLVVGPFLEALRQMNQILAFGSGKDSRHGILKIFVLKLTLEVLCCK